MFHSMHEPSAADVKSGKVREFTGDGESKLPVPGLIGDPTSVRVGSIELPARIETTFINNKLNGEKITTDMPLLKVDRDAHDVPVLLRSIRSNNGYWQKGVKVYVWGEWKDDPSSKPATAESAETAPAETTTPEPDPAEALRANLDKLSPAKLTEAAKTVGVEPGATKAETITRILGATAKNTESTSF